RGGGDGLTVVLRDLRPRRSAESRAAGFSAATKTFRDAGTGAGLVLYFTTLHLVMTASVICPASWAQLTSSTLTEIDLPTKPLSCAAWASLVVTSWNVSGPVSRLHSPVGGGRGGRS